MYPHICKYFSTVVKSYSLQIYVTSKKYAELEL